MPGELDAGKPVKTPAASAAPPDNARMAAAVMKVRIFI
jgi:hypothetical protein